MHFNDTLKITHVEVLYDGDQTSIHVSLCRPEDIHGRAWLRVCPRGRPECAALHRIHVEKVDD